MRQHASGFTADEEHAPVIFLGEEQRSDLTLQVPQLLRGRPVYGLSLLGQDAEDRDVVDASDPRIEDIAERLLPDVRALIAPGPAHLVAEGHAGLVAYELALRLQASGRGPCTLVLIDCRAPDYPDQLSWLERVYIHLRMLGSLPLRDSLDYAAKRAVALSRHRARTFAHRWHAARARRRRGRDVVRVERALAAACARYELRAGTLDVTLFYASEDPQEPVRHEPELGFRRAVRGPFHVVRMTPAASARRRLWHPDNAEVLGDRLRAGLDQKDRARRARLPRLG